MMTKRLINLGYFILVITLFFPLISSSQEEGLIVGRVTESETGDPLVGANVYLKKDLSIGTVTDFNGYFQLKSEVGMHVFMFSFTGMKTIRKEINIVVDSIVNLNILMETFSTQFDEVVVKAGKFDKNIEQQTVSIEVMSPRIINARNTTSVEQILNLTPGLTILDEEPQIRGGSGFTFGVGSKVAVFVDDMPITSGDAGKPNWSLIPVENIKQIEVVKGASSVLSGSAALSGAIYIRTVYPGIKPETKLKVYGGFYDAPLSSSQKWWNGVNYLGGLSFLHSRRIHDGNTDLVLGAFVATDRSYVGAPVPGPNVSDTNDISDSDMINKKARVNFGLRRRSTKHKGLDYGINGNMMYSKTSTALAWLDDSTNFYRAYPGAVLLSNNLTYYFDPYVNFYSGMGIKHQFKNRIYYSDNQANNDQSNRVFMLFNQYQFSKSFSNIGGLDFIGGLSSTYTHSTANMYDASGSPKNYIWNASLFMEIEKKFGDALNLSAGVRMEHFRINDSIRDSKPILRVGASLKLAQETYLRTSIGQGYRFPTITERFIKTSVGSFGVFNNPDLVPETSWNAELGIKQGFKVSKFYGYLDVALFYQEYHNTIEYLFGFWDSTYTFAYAGFKFVNTGKSKISGVDISVNGQAKISKDFEIYSLFGYTYVMPVTLEPDLIFAKDYNPGGKTEFSYNSTSVDPSRKILKYRFIHTLKIDMEFVYKKFSMGFSAKYFSKIENLDQAIFDFEQATLASGGTLQPVLYKKYFENNNNGNLILDARLSYSFGRIHKIAIISDNILNRWYSLRPLKAEPMRSFTIQYNLKI
jgi:iron complex outermembrane receptor protein